MDLIIFKFFCINIKKVAWIFGKSLSPRGYQKYFAGEYRITLLWGAHSWVKYVIEVDLSRMRHLCWWCTRFEDSEPSLRVSFQFSTGKSWEESTSSAINRITEGKGCILRLDMIICLSAMSLHAFRRKLKALHSVKSTRNIYPAESQTNGKLKDRRKVGAAGNRRKGGKKRGRQGSREEGSREGEREKRSRREGGRKESRQIQTSFFLLQLVFLHEILLPLVYEHYAVLVLPILTSCPLSISCPRIQCTHFLSLFIPIS